MNNFIKKETPTQVFSCEFCEICKNTFLHRAPPVAAYKSKSNSGSNGFLQNTSLKLMKEKKVRLEPSHW